eukprot:2966718-Pyramimonas_sp.AAC.1
MLCCIFGSDVRLRHEHICTSVSFCVPQAPVMNKPRLEPRALRLPDLPRSGAAHPGAAAAARGARPR